MQIVYKIIAAGVMAAMHPAIKGGDDPAKIVPTGEIKGHDTLLEIQLVRMIRDQKAWSELWTAHKGISDVPGAAGTIYNGDARPAPAVDFTKNQILIVFGGHTYGVQAYDYVTTVVHDGTAVIRLAPSLFPSQSPQVIMYPYTMLTLPRLKVPIDVELDTIANDGTHYWNKIAGYQPPKDAVKASG